MKHIQEALDELYLGISRCIKECPLHKARKKLVRDKEGNWRSGIILVGEAPGREEIEKGMPFVGMAGKNLGEFLDHAGLDRKMVYITNVLRCRPTKNKGKANRGPTKKEMELCSAWLTQELDVIRPKVIITLGNVALQTVCYTPFKVTECHGQVLPSQWGPVFPVFHPAYATYRRDLKTVIEQDFQKLAKVLSTLRIP